MAPGSAPAFVRRDRPKRAAPLHLESVRALALSQVAPLVLAYRTRFTRSVPGHRTSLVIDEIVIGRGRTELRVSFAYDGVADPTREDIRVIRLLVARIAALRASVRNVAR